MIILNFLMKNWQICILSLELDDDKRHSLMYLLKTIVLKSIILILNGKRKIKLLVIKSIDKRHETLGHLSMERWKMQIRELMQSMSTVIVLVIFDLL